MWRRGPVGRRPERARRAGQKRLPDKAGRPGRAWAGQGRYETKPAAATHHTACASTTAPDHSFYIPGHYLYAPGVSPPFLTLPPIQSDTHLPLPKPLLRKLLPASLTTHPHSTSARAVSRQEEQLPIRRHRTTATAGVPFFFFFPQDGHGHGPAVAQRQRQLDGVGRGAGAVPVGRRRSRFRGVRAGREGALRRRHLRLRRRGVADRGGDGVHDRAGDGERAAARRRHWGHLRRRLLHRGRRGVAGPLAIRRLRRLDHALHGGHHLQPPERQAGPGEGGAGGPERRAESDQRHQLAVRGDERPVRDGRREGRPGGRAAAAAGDGDRGGRRRGRGRGGAVLLGVPAGLPGGRGRAEAPRLPPRVPRALHRLLARQARLLPALPPRHLNNYAMEWITACAAVNRRRRRVGRRPGVQLTVE